MTSQVQQGYIDLQMTAGMAIKFALLMSHYRRPCEIGPAKLAEARKSLRRLLMACSPNLSGPPVEFLEIISDDLNTPAAIAKMHQWRGLRQGDKIFASLRFLGFFDQQQTMLDEVKTYPPGSLFGDPQLVGLPAEGTA